MTNQNPNLPAFPAGYPFPESQRESVPGRGADFPSGAGPAEHARLRPSKTPGLNQVAVTNDDGTVIGYALVPSFVDMLTELTAIRVGIQMLVNEFLKDNIDLLEEVTITDQPL